MKHLRAFFLIAMLTAAALPALAATEGGFIVPQPGMPGYPDVTKPRDVAQIYYRLMGQLPPFDAWVRFTPEYKQMSESEQADYIESAPAQMEQEFRLMTTDQRIVAPFSLQLSNYNYESGGYIAKNIDEGVYFPYMFAGRKYAVLPMGLADYQFLGVTREAAKLIEPVLKSTGHKITMAVSLTPTRADSKPVELPAEDGTTVQYIPVVAKVSKLTFYACKEKEPCQAVWSTGSKEERENTDNGLGELFIGTGGR